MNKIKHLEGLRGIAAIVVVFGHLYRTCFLNELKALKLLINGLTIPSFLKSLAISTIDLSMDGNLSVWIFWLLSSYVISISFFKPRHNYDGVVISYFSKRYVRLFIPVLGSILLGYLLLKAGFMYNKRLALIVGKPYLNGWLDMFYSFDANFVNALKAAFFETFFQYDGSYTSYNSVLWSIQNEFLGSLFIFGLFGVIRHNKKRHLLYLLIIILLFILQMHWLVVFVLGYVLCDYDFANEQYAFSAYLKKIEKKVFSYNILTFILFIIIICLGRRFLDHLGLSEGNVVEMNLQSLILSFIIVYFVIKNSYLNKLLSLRLPYWLGNISFSLYLLHTLVLCSFTTYFLTYDTSAMYKVLLSIITIIICLILSVFYTRYIDKNSVKIANRIGNYFKNNA